MANINLKVGFSSDFITIPNIFIDEYIPKANPMFVSIYLFCYKCASNNQAFNSEDIASKFNILESDVINAWKYWKSKNIIDIIEDNGNYNITFNEIKSTKEQNNIIKHNFTSKPSYNEQEIEFYKQQNEQVGNLFKLAKEKLKSGEDFTKREMDILLGIPDWIGLPYDVIEMLIEFCVENGHRTLRYIEKVAIDWKGKEIDTVKKAQNFIQLFKYKKEIMNAFGSYRQPVEEEEKYIDKWLKVYKMNIDVIKKACNKAVMQTDKVNFAYADTIIEDWRKNNINTLEDVKTAEDEFKKTNKQSKNKVNNFIQRPNKFVNYKQPDIDFDEIKKWNRRMNMKELKKS